MVHFKVNLIFLIKICAIDKSRSEANFSDASRFSSYSLYAHARGMRNEKVMARWDPSKGGSIVL